VAIRGSLLASPRESLGVRPCLELPRVNGDLVNPRGLVPGRDKEEGALSQVELVAIDDHLPTVPVLSRARPGDPTTLFGVQLTSELPFPAAPADARAPVGGDNQVDLVVPGEPLEGVGDPGTVFGQGDRAAARSPALARGGGATTQNKSDGQTRNNDAQPGTPTHGHTFLQTTAPPNW